jgi:hypothetical protein
MNLNSRSSTVCLFQRVLIVFVSFMRVIRYVVTVDEFFRFQFDVDSSCVKKTPRTKMKKLGIKYDVQQQFDHNYMS